MIEFLTVRHDASPHSQNGALVTYQELVKTIQGLPLSERLSLLEVLTHSLQTDIQYVHGQKSSLTRIRGMLKVNGPALTDAEIEDDYTNYLIEKYA